MTTGSVAVGLPAVRSPFADAMHAASLGARWAIGILLAALAVAVLVLPAGTGSTALTVLTGSMRPSLPPGTLVVVRPVDAGEIRTGDVITFQIDPGRPEVVTHRVVAVQSLADGSRAFVTRGDANPGPDAASVLPGQIHGRLWYSIPLVGTVALLAGAHRTALFTTAGVALLGYAGAVVIAALVRARRGRSTRHVLDRRARHAASGGGPSARRGFRAPRIRRPRP